MASFADILNTRAADVEAPKPFPVGTYTGLIDSKYTINEERGLVEFQIRFVAPEADVDPQAIVECGGIQGKSIRHTVWLMNQDGTPAFRAKQFFVEVLGLDEDMTLSKLIAESAGRQLKFTVKHVPSKDGTQMYSNVGDVFKA